MARQADVMLRECSPDNTYEVLINDESAKKGSLLEDFDPPVNPSVDINDPNDFKPADWVDESQIVDTSATKVCATSTGCLSSYADRVCAYVI